ncbi:ABC transporter substrate-binding protein [Bacillus horti]|uniref:Sn-glycerol 3-phosphate transport system substrate-binding protein n=1 Tax=Caldalkalibacillus horti TaxID=77523 RepID=A0ABT9VYG3_9BACI|nr:ABC transporter substrate-binding protein [Bacillus horti]MDQ0165905.1 sn-glycerol 3-phosphate transport system substrate-binding protein [Bacillus horti]
MKKWIVTAVMMMLVLALAACGGEPSSTGQGRAQGASTGGAGGNEGSSPVEIQYWYAWGDKIGENNENLVKQFNESQDEVIVHAHYQGTYDDLHSKTQAAFAAKNAPEVTQNEIASIGIFAKSGLTQDLTPFVERDQVDMDDFVQGLMGNSYVDGKLYGLPYLRSTPILYINSTMAEEAGLDPAGPSSWEEFEEYARKLTVPGDRVGITMPINIWFFEGFVAQSNGRMISEDGEKAEFNGSAGVEALNLWLRMKEEGTLKIPTGDDAGAVTRQDFLNQKAGMVFSSTADLTLLLQIAEEGGFELNTTFMPANENYGVPTGGANLVMTAGLSEEKQEAAWTFIKWMTEKEQTIYASSFTGYLPSRYSAIESDEMKQLYEEKPQFKVAVDQLEFGRPRPMEAVYPEVSKILQDQISRAILDTGIKPEDALNEAASRADELLNR